MTVQGQVGIYRCGMAQQLQPDQVGVAVAVAVGAREVVAVLRGVAPDPGAARLVHQRRVGKVAGEHAVALVHPARDDLVEVRRNGSTMRSIVPGDEDRAVPGRAVLGGRGAAHPGTPGRMSLRPTDPRTSDCISGDLEPLVAAHERADELPAVAALGPAGSRGRGRRSRTCRAASGVRGTLPGPEHEVLLHQVRLEDRALEVEHRDHVVARRRSGGGCGRTFAAGLEANTRVSVVIAGKCTSMK